jgi:endonuclease YncB( thermonuclease family)
VAVLVVLFALAAVVAALLEPLPPALSGKARVADGDTLHLGSDRVRFLGLDAPELNQTCTDAGGDSWPCGRESSDRLRALIGNRSVACTTEGRDKYGRYLGRCSVGGKDLGAILVSEGLAIASFPDYGPEEASAKREKRGLWAGRFDTPRQWRDTHGDTASGFDLFGTIRDLFR